MFLKRQWLKLEVCFSASHINVLRWAVLLLQATEDHGYLPSCCWVISIGHGPHSQGQSWVSVNPGSLQGGRKDKLQDEPFSLRKPDWQRFGSFPHSPLVMWRSPQQWDVSIKAWNAEKCNLQQGGYVSREKVRMGFWRQIATNQKHQSQDLSVKIKYLRKYFRVLSTC